MSETKLTDWQPIETAPKDGTEMLLTGPSWDGLRPGEPPYVALGGWYHGDWREDKDDECFARLWTPTHWMPLPEPPAALSSKKG